MIKFILKKIKRKKPSHEISSVVSIKVLSGINTVEVINNEI